MKKIMLQGPNADMDYDINNEDIEILNNEESFDDFLNPTKDKRAGAEIFLYAHGNTELTEVAGDILNLYSSERSNDNKANKIIARIAYNTEPEEVNIIHVLAYHSSDIHNHIKRIEGNIVLLAYSRSDDVAWSDDCEHFYNSRVNNNESIICNS
ncbi:hypothetical protein [Rickettsia sp. TH2014]|uniref:hypothetical protein n=1 Tax=Rickettsia sp. TH2014 TaxID=1967503 RepID=UPI001C459D37|nr:hypothetical protein [Rickettsia sp. TH2014]